VNILESESDGVFSTGWISVPVGQPEQSFHVQDGDKIVIDKSKLRPVFNKDKNGTIITIEPKEVSDDQP
jgi:hypothetical protein